ILREHLVERGFEHAKAAQVVDELDRGLALLSAYDERSSAAGSAATCLAAERWAPCGWWARRSLAARRRRSRRGATRAGGPTLSGARLLAPDRRRRLIEGGGRMPPRSARR